VASATGTISQGSPTSDSTDVAGSLSYVSAPLTVSGSSGSLSFTVTPTPSSPGLVLNSDNEIATTGTLPASNTPYTIGGTDTDSASDTGTWSFSLTVTPDLISQSSPTTGTIQSSESGSYVTSIEIENNIGAVSFTTTKSNVNLAVSGSGEVSTTGALSAGTYSVSGTDIDPHGDQGTWTFTLTVTASDETVTFDANGGTGSMASESDTGPAALTLNHFTRSRHTFVHWNTEANGSGVNYANGAQYSFATSSTLYAQWKARKIASHIVTFAPNHGTGVMIAETAAAPTAISSNRFRRNGYKFVDWNTSAKGAGRSFAAGVTYSFARSLVLFAQWTKEKVALPPQPSLEVVVFAANGGAGTMVDERHRKPVRLTSNHFARKGYTFLGWNTSPSGAGVSYANGVTYPFVSSATLYAQWKKKKRIIPPPPVPQGTRIGPFAQKSSTLTSALESQIQALAIVAKGSGDKQISLLGYGDRHSGNSESNAASRSANYSLSRERAQAVATYLEGRLSALGLNGFSISIAAASAGGSYSEQGASSIVVAILS